MTQSAVPNNGERIRTRIKEKGLTQSDFAEKMGYEERTIRKWLKNGVTDYRLLVQIANIFEYNIHNLFLE